MLDVGRIKSKALKLFARGNAGKINPNWQPRSPSTLRITMASDREQMKLEPPHPGEFIREDILPALGMTIKDLAKHLGVSRVALSELVNERRAVSLEMAQ